MPRPAVAPLAAAAFKRHLTSSVLLVQDLYFLADPMKTPEAVFDALRDAHDNLRKAKDALEDSGG